MVDGDDMEVKGAVKGISSLPLTEFESILKRIKMAYGVNSDGALAKKFGVYRQTISQARKKRIVPPKWYFQTSQATGCSIDWLLKGQAWSQESSTRRAGFFVSEPDYPYANRMELKHTDIIRKFKDKPLAKEIDRDLLELEKISPVAFRQVSTYIKGVVEGLKMAGGQETADRRKYQRRQADDPDKMPDGVERREGTDRPPRGT